MEYPLDEKETNRIIEAFRSRGYDAELVWMTPESFLSKVPHPITELVPAIANLAPKYFSQSSMRWITEAILSKTKLPPLILDYTSMFRGYPTHEGRHRAYVAWLIGITSVPVVVVR